MKSIMIVCVAVLMSAVPAFAQEEEVVLNLGEERVLELPDIAKGVDLSDANVVSVSKSGTKSRIIVSARRRGVTKLTFRLADGTSLSYQVRVGERFASAKATLAQITGLSVSERGSKLIVKGQLQNRADVQTLRRVKERYPGVIVDMTEQNIAETNTVIKTINRILRENDLGNMQAHAYGRILVLEGSAKDGEQAELALRIAKLIAPGIEDRVDKKTNGAPAISIEVMFVEVRSDDDRTVGFDHTLGGSGSSKGKGIASVGVQPKTGTVHSGNLSMNWQIGGLFSFLQLFEERTFSRVLSNPKLVARSGSEAKFHAGETKYLTDLQVQDDQVITNYIPVDAGIMLKIVPHLDAIGQIDSQITTEVSEFSGEGKQNLPSVSKSSLQTAVTIRDGETVMLSGLVRKKNTKKVSRVPILADIPVVGELFKSRNVKDSDTEMIILVTMKRVQEFSDRIKAAGQKLWDQAGDDIKFSLSD